MTHVTERRRFSRLGDQQLLDQTQRLVANQRCLEVHLIDHLNEIDRRGLALRRGYSSLFDYAVRELGFSDASAQRRIQTMRLCRRYGWVRAELQSGKFDLTSAALLETAFAGAERQARQRGSRSQEAGRQEAEAGVAAATAPAAAAQVATGAAATADEQVVEQCAAPADAPPSAPAGVPASVESPCASSLSPQLPAKEPSPAASTRAMAPLLDPQRQRER